MLAPTWADSAALSSATAAAPAAMSGTANSTAAAGIAACGAGAAAGSTATTAAATAVGCGALAPGPVRDIDGDNARAAAFLSGVFGPRARLGSGVFVRCVERACGMYLCAGGDTDRQLTGAPLEISVFVHLSPSAWRAGVGQFFTGVLPVETLALSTLPCAEEGTFSQRFTEPRIGEGAVVRWTRKGCGACFDVLC